MNLSQHDFLTPEECSRCCNSIQGLKEYWVNRAGGFMPFYTLGAASYLDAVDDNQEAYRQVAECLNPILKAHFPLLYDHLIEILTEVFALPVAFAEEKAVPGFHIFLANKMFENPIGRVHFDMQFQLLRWNYREVDFAHPISFTCALTVPDQGAGLNYWEITQQEAKGLSKQELEILKNEREIHFFPYELGKLVLHRELILHQIAPSKEMKLGDTRITLQGHGLVCDGILRLYW